jgi:phage I-like protein
MPLPIPGDFKTMDDFMSECLVVQANEKDKTDEQKVAICYSTWKNKDKPKETPPPAQAEKEMKLKKLEIKLDIQPSSDWQKIKIFPKGDIQANGETLTFDDKFFQSMMQNLNNKDIPTVKMDKNHEYKENYAEFRNPTIEKDGFYLEIKLNPEGVKLVKDKVYTSISPAYGEYTDPKGVKHENVLYAVSLTNFPALGTTIPALGEQIKLEQNTKGEKSMDKEILKELGLIETSDSKVQLEAVKKLKLSLEIETQKNKELSKQIDDIKLKELEKEAISSIDEALKHNQIHSVLREKYIKRYMQNPSDVIEELKLLPKRQSGEMLTASQSIDGKVELSIQDIEAMHSIKLDEKNKDDVKIFLESKQKAEAKLKKKG